MKQAAHKHTGWAFPSSNAYLSNTSPTGLSHFPQETKPVAACTFRCFRFLTGPATNRVSMDATDAQDYAWTLISEMSGFWNRTGIERPGLVTWTTAHFN